MYNINASRSGKRTVVKRPKLLFSLIWRVKNLKMGIVKGIHVASSESKFSNDYFYDKKLMKNRSYANFKFKKE